MTTIIVALIGAIFGGFGIELIKNLVLPKSKRVDVAIQFRDELRGDVNTLKLELRQLRKECDYYRKLYFMSVELLAIRGIDIPDELKKPYNDDPTTPTI